MLTEYAGKIYISSRSIDEINVQLIMERMGGGGHLNVAGAQLTGCTISEQNMPLCGPLMKCLKKEIYRNESNFITGCESSWEKGEIVNVSDGYARNAILPKKLGVEATTKNLNDLKLQNQHADKVAAENLEHAKELAEEIGTKKLL